MAKRKQPTKTGAKLSAQPAAKNETATTDDVSTLEVTRVVELTDAIVKTKYERNPNTNAYTDGEKTKVGDMAAAIDAELGSNVWRQGGGVAPVDSVNGQTGAVVLDTDDIAEGANLYYTDARVAATPAVAANTAKVSADGSINTHNDVDITTIAPTDGQVLAWSAANNQFRPADQSGGGVAGGQFDLTEGAVIARGEYIGNSAPTISSPAAGEYVLTVPSGTRVISFTLFGNNTTLNGSNEFVVRVDNSGNGIQRSYTVGQYNVTNGSAVDKFTLGTNETESFPSANVTQLLFPGMNGFGSTGFRIVLS